MVEEEDEEVASRDATERLASLSSTGESWGAVVLLTSEVGRDSMEESRVCWVVEEASTLLGKFRLAIGLFMLETGAAGTDPSMMPGRRPEEEREGSK